MLNYQPSCVVSYMTYGPDGNYTTRETVVSGPFYHGSRARVRCGTLLTPGRKPNPWGDTFDGRGRSVYIYFATDPETAIAYARQTGGHLYEVEPAGVVDHDATGGDGSYRTRGHLRVIREIPQQEWAALNQ